MIAEKRFEKAIDEYGNEDFLKIFPKEQLIASMEQVFNSKELEFEMYEPENIQILKTYQKSTITEKNKITYAKLRYNQKIDIKYNGNDLKPDQLLPALKREFGNENVLYNSQTGVYEILSVKDAVAASKDLKNWKFTIIENNQIDLIKTFIPQEILK